MRLIEVVSVVVGIAWLAFYSSGWTYRVLIAGAFLALVIVHSTLNKTYERTGIAVRIPRVVAVSYPGGLPNPLRFLRVGFLAAVLLMLFFGVAPLPFNISHLGVIGCVLGLFLVGVAHFIIERHYANTGRALDEYDTSSK